MAIYFKFKSWKFYESVDVDGSFLSVAALKEKIYDCCYKSWKVSDSKGICKGFDIDLLITNAQTNDHYYDDNTLIPRYTSVLVSRVPGSSQRRPKRIDTSTIILPGSNVPLSSISLSSKNTVTGSSAEDHIRSVSDDDKKIEVGSNGDCGNIAGFKDGVPPEGYVCRRCHVAGHFIQDCPTNGNPDYDFKRGGHSAVPVPVSLPDKAEFDELMEEIRSTELSASDFPPELLCHLCKQVMNYAMFTAKCCFRTFCDQCIRDYLISSKMNCVCGATNMLCDYLIPNKTIRNMITSIFENGSLSSHIGENAKTSSQHQSSSTVSSYEKKRKLVDASELESKKARTFRASDVSEAMRKEAATATNVQAAAEEEKVQEKRVSAEIGKKNKKRKRKNSDNVEIENYVMPTGYYPCYFPFNDVMLRTTFSSL